MYLEVFGENLTHVDTKNFQGAGEGQILASYDAPRTMGVRFGMQH